MRVTVASVELTTTTAAAHLMLDVLLHTLMCLFVTFFHVTPRTRDVTVHVSAAATAISACVYILGALLYAPNDEENGAGYPCAPSLRATLLLFSCMFFTHACDERPKNPYYTRSVRIALARTVRDPRLWAIVTSFVATDLFVGFVGGKGGGYLFVSAVRFGVVAPHLVRYAALVSVASVAGLVAWSFRRGGDHGSIVVELAPHMTSPARVVMFALTNAAVEEIFFRGVVMSALLREDHTVVAPATGLFLGLLSCAAIGFHHCDHARPIRRGRPSSTTSTEGGFVVVLMILASVIASSIAIAPGLWIADGWRSDVNMRFTFAEFVALAVQALLFAELHRIDGFPCGPLGFIMTFVWSVMIGMLRIRTNGLFLCYCAHVAGDLCVGFLVYRQRERARKRL
eukprot:g2576.t1